MHRKRTCSVCFILMASLAGASIAAYPLQQDPGPDGIVSVEAENFDGQTTAPDGHAWNFIVLPAGFSGTGAMQALPNIINIRRRDPYGDNGYLTLSPRLDFKVSFVKTGTHYVWIRGHANGSGNDDDCHLGLNYPATPTGAGEQITFYAAANWGWFNISRKIAGPANLWVPSAGVHTVNIWMCENGAIIDKIVLTTNPAYKPTDAGPAGPEESTRGNPLFVDDFENYDENKKISETWIPASGTGATIGHPASPYVEQTIVHSGSKSMPYYYDNKRADKAHYSEAEADTSNLGIGPDWTKEGAKALTLHFYGDPDNDANATERMYVALEDNDSVAVAFYDGNPNDVREAKWHQWDIKLTDFTNVDLINVKKVYIGFGNRNHPTSGGSGLVYFDDIRLYPSRCVPSRVKGNFNDDCVVDYADLKVMTDGWLNDYQFEDFASLADSWLEEVLWPQ
jgi:hypothetical protein